MRCIIPTLLFCLVTMTASADVDLERHVIEPTGSHSSTIILLHGTSQTGVTFSEPLLSFRFPSLLNTSSPTATDGLTSLVPLFPNTRWVFPTGHPRKTTVFNGNVTNAWFDIHNFTDRTIGENDSIPGLHESVISLTQLVKDELEVLDGRGSLVISGFSQGSAMSMMLLLSGELERLGIRERTGGIAGFAAMSGWLPFRRQIGEVVAVGGSSEIEKKRAAREYVRDLLLLEPFSCDEVAFMDVPVWLGHGEIDEKVKLQWGQEMRDVLLAIGVDVGLSTYENLAHWWNEEEIVDLVKVLRRMLLL